MVRKKIEVTEEEKVDTSVQESDAVEDQTSEAEDAPIEPTTPKRKGGLKRFLKTKKGKAVAIVAGVILLVAIIMAIPFTRYATFGLVVKKDVSVTVQDASTSKMVSDAEVTIGTVTARTDGAGRAILKSVPVGQYDMKIDKQYYKDYTESVTVPIFGSADRGSSIVATGRPVEVTVVNTISGDAIADATISISDTTATTDSEGVGTIVLPNKLGDQTGTIEKDGYNTADITVNVKGGQTDQTVSLTPEGKIFYLSKATGKIDVMKANLDGTDASIVVQGSGSEDDYGTVLLSTRDWQYSALQSSRDGDGPKLYVVSAKDGGLKTIDDTKGTYSLIGWQGHTFFYTSYGDEGYYTIYRLKAYNAETGKLTTIDTANDDDSLYQTLSGGYIVGQYLVYIGTRNNIDSKAEIISVNTTTLSKKVVKEFQEIPAYGFGFSGYEPGGLYIRWTGYSNNEYYEFENGAIKPADIDDDKFYSNYATYLQSPSGNKTFWYEERDGKNTIFVGDEDGKNGKQIATLSDYKPYGWFGADDQYLLLSKNGSELYIAPADREISDGSILKITNYHKPAYSYAGYGSGYGGQ